MPTLSDASAADLSWKQRNCIMSNFSFCHNVFKSIQQLNLMEIYHNFKSRLLKILFNLLQHYHEKMNRLIQIHGFKNPFTASIQWQDVSDVTCSIRMLYSLCRLLHNAVFLLPILEFNLCFGIKTVAVCLNL